MRRGELREPQVGRAARQPRHRAYAELSAAVAPPVASGCPAWSASCSLNVVLSAQLFSTGTRFPHQGRGATNSLPRREASARRALLLRVAPAAIGAYELRFLIEHLPRLAASIGLRSLAAPAFLLLLISAGFLVRESARGLVTRFTRPPWSAKLLGSWVVCSVILALAFCATELLSASAGPEPLAHWASAANWPAAIPAIMVAGLLLAVALRGARWLLGRVGRLRSSLRPARRPPLRLWVRIVELAAATAPLQIGWSDRGPPSAVQAN